MATAHSRYWCEVKKAAAVEGLDPYLVDAVVLRESSGNADAFRFEPGFYNRYLKKLPQYVGRNPRRISSSYGLMQVMWTTALESGYPAERPPESLFVPEVALAVGCKHLAKCLKWARNFPGTEEQHVASALAAYNGGRHSGNKPGQDPLTNGVYAKKVLATYKLLRELP